MENAEDVDAEQIFRAAGIDCNGLMDKGERERLLEVLKESVRDQHASSSSLETSEKNITVLDDVKEENLKPIEPASFYGKQSDSNSFSPSNINQSFGDKGVSKLSVSKSVDYAGVLGSSGKPGSSRPHKPENRPVPGVAVPVRDTEQNLNKTPNVRQNQSNESGWLEAKKENGVTSRRSLALSKEEEKADEAKDNESKDSSNNMIDNSKDRDSPEILDEGTLTPLMNLLFEKRSSSCLFSENSLPPVSLPKEEWVSQVGQSLFDRKAARIRSEARQAKWITLAERTFNVNCVVKAVARASPSHNKDEVASNFTENRKIDIETSPKARTSPDNVGDNVRESSPDVAVLENSPKQDLDTGENAQAIALPDALNKGKNDTPQNSSLGRNIDDVGCVDDPNRRRSIRNRKQRGKGARGGVRSGSSGLIEDNSNGAQNSSTSRNNEREYSRNNANYPPIGGSAGSSYAENTIEEELKECPMCRRRFPETVIEGHAWECLGDVAEEKEGETQVADHDENGGRNIITKTEQVRITLSDTDSDDSDFKIKTPQSRKRNIFISEDDDDDERPPKTPRK